jgi:hypothetical protein
MTEMSTFEQRLAAELEEMAGPGRRIDATAMVRTLSTRPLPWRTRIGLGSTRSGTARLVLVGAFVAAVAIFLLSRVSLSPDADHAAPAAPSQSPAPTGSADPLSGLVTQQIEPGVLRVLRDDAGHDLDQGHPDHRYDLDRMTITGDGTIWLQSTYHESDNQAHPAGALLWALGRPGVFAMTDSLAGDLVPLTNDSILVIGEHIVRFDGTVIVPDDARAVRLVHGGALWLREPAAPVSRAGGVSDAPPADRRAVIWDGEDWVGVSELGRSVSSDGSSCAVTEDGVACQDQLFGNDARYLAGTRINEVARAPDGAVWAVGSFEGEGGGLYRITLDR